MAQYTVLQKDKLRCELYNAFYKKNTKLYEDNVGEYHRKSGKFVDAQLRILLNQELCEKTGLVRILEKFGIRK